MATDILKEAPQWAVERESNFHKKHMDEGALIPFELLSPYDQKRQKGRWRAYAYTLDDPKRAYVYGAAVSLVGQHASKYDSYTLVDLGAGNGQNTVKTATMINTIAPHLVSRFYLVEQSGPALDEAKKLFNRNGFKSSTQFLQEDITGTTLSSESMDAVTIVNVWHHLSSWEKLQASAMEIDRILKPGGLFVVVDTRPLPSTGFRRRIIEGKIRGAVSFENFLERAQREGLDLDEAEKAGMKDFCKHDAFKAFENALTKGQFEETLKKSALAPSLQEMGDLRSSHPFFRFVYPSLNIAWGIKK